MNTIQFYGFWGTMAYDFMIYLAELLSREGYQVLIADYSEDKYVLRCIPKPEEQIDFIHYQKTDFLGECFLSKKQIEKYEFIFVMLPITFSEELVFWVEGDAIWPQWKHIYVFTDFYRKNLEKTGELLEKLSFPVWIIFRDVCSSLITPDYFKAVYLKEAGVIEKEFLLPFDEIDYANRICLEYEGITEYKRVSEDMERILLFVLSEILSISEKQVKKLYKRKGGRIII